MSVDPQSVLVLLTLALGAYVQAVTGFAMGLIVVGVVALAGWVSVAVVAAVVSVATFFNVAAALPGRLHEVHWRESALMTAGMVPAVFGGLLLLDHLGAAATQTLHTVLAMSILGGGILLTLRPAPRARAAGSLASLTMGTVGGVMTGMFATGGPPVVYHMYRQPYAVATIRATLLATFGIACVARLSLLAIRGDLTPEVLGLAAASLPVVVAATLVGRRFPLPLSAHNTRRLAFAFLVAIGLTMLVL